MITWSDRCENHIVKFPYGKSTFVLTRRSCCRLQQGTTA